MNYKRNYKEKMEPARVPFRNGRITMYYVPFDVIKNNDEYEFNQVIITADKYNYDGLVDAIIKIKYDISKEMSILNNFLNDSKNEKYKKEFLELQEWRIFAKTEAKKHFNMI